MGLQQIIFCVINAVPVNLELSPRNNCIVTINQHSYDFVFGVELFTCANIAYCFVRSNNAANLYLTCLLLVLIVISIRRPWMFSVGKIAFLLAQPWTLSM